MPNYSGLQIIDVFSSDEIDFNVVFTATYDEYVVRASDINAIAYLLKRLRPNLLKEAVAKIQKQMSQEVIR